MRSWEIGVHLSSRHYLPGSMKEFEGLNKEGSASFSQRRYLSNPRRSQIGHMGTVGRGAQVEKLLERDIAKLEVFIWLHLIRYAPYCPATYSPFRIPSRHGEEGS